MQHLSERSEGMLICRYMKKTTHNATYDIQYHFVWIPKYRKRILKGKIGQRVKQLIYEYTKINQFEVLELSIQQRPYSSLTFQLNQDIHQQK